MIISRTPFRLSLFGGGTDLEEYYKEGKGEVISLSLEESLYVTVNKRFDGKIHLRYSQTELGSTPEELKHDIVRECLKLSGIKRGVEIVTISDIPSVGTGLGSSSALTVGLLNALFAVRGLRVPSKDLAEMACEIEIGKLKHPIGKQDQYATAYGGFNHITFNKDGSVKVEDLYDGWGTGRQQLLNELINSLALFYIPNGRRTAKILNKYKAGIQKNRGLLDKHLALVHRFLDALDKGVISNGEVGRGLSVAWAIKKESSPATNGLVDSAISSVISGGAYGAKMCGAGQGGFMVGVVERGLLPFLEKLMTEKGFVYLPCKFYSKGSSIIYRR